MPPGQQCVWYTHKMFTSAVIKSNQNLMLTPDWSGDPFMALHPSKCQMSCPHEVVLDICLAKDSQFQTFCFPPRNAHSGSGASIRFSWYVEVGITVENFLLIHFTCLGWIFVPRARPALRIIRFSVRAWEMNLLICLGKFMFPHSLWWFLLADFLFRRKSSSKKPKTYKSFLV